MDTMTSILNQLKGQHLDSGKRILSDCLGNSPKETNVIIKHSYCRELVIWSDGINEFKFVISDQFPNFYWCWSNGTKCKMAK